MSTETQVPATIAGVCSRIDINLQRRSFTGAACKINQLHIEYIPCQVCVISIQVEMDMCECRQILPVGRKVYAMTVYSCILLKCIIPSYR